MPHNVVTFFASPTMIRLVCKCVSDTNTLAYKSVLEENIKSSFATLNRVEQSKTIFISAQPRGDNKEY
jgi:hypothetical protein